MINTAITNRFSPPKGITASQTGGRINVEETYLDSFSPPKGITASQTILRRCARQL